MEPWTLPITLVTLQLKSLRGSKPSETRSLNIKPSNELAWSLEENIKRHNLKKFLSDPDITYPMRRKQSHKRKNQNSPVNRDLNHTPFIKDSYHYYMKARGYPSFFDPAQWTKNNTSQTLKDKTKLMRKINQGVQREEVKETVPRGKNETQEKESRIEHGLGVQPSYYYVQAKGTRNHNPRVRFDKNRIYIKTRSEEKPFLKIKIVY